MNKTVLFFVSSFVLLSLLSCDDSSSLTASYEAPDRLPESLQTGTPLGDAQMSLFDDLGVATYINPENDRFRQDIVSDQGTINLENVSPPDSSAAMFAIEMARIFYEELPDDKKDLMPRNFYFMKEPLQSGSGFSAVSYEAYLWYNSTGDVTLGSLNAASLDTTQLKGSFYYALSSILRNMSRNQGFYSDFQSVVESANEAGKYYFYVQDQQTAYENGFVSADQSKISGDRLDFDMYAFWAITVEPQTREQVLDQYNYVNQKYQVVRSMFQQEGINLEELNEKWQSSPLNPDNN